MVVALRLARRGLGNVWPNPAVGCVIVKNNHIIARGWTQAGGRPHAETHALAQAVSNTDNAVAFVTLEPCCHHGQTSPCTTALISAKLARVVIACIDPDPRVNGKGIKQLQEAKIAITIGLKQTEAQELNAGFFLRIEQNRPLVTLKLVTSLDGAVATRMGDSHWISGAQTRQWSHGLRMHHDAILIGRGTMMADNPSLTCRLPGLGHRSPVRVILDSRARVPLDQTLIITARQTPTWMIVSQEADPTRCAQLTSMGVHVIKVARDDHGRLSPKAILVALAHEGITRLLIEGGPSVASSFLIDDCVDRLVWIHAPIMIGRDGLKAIDILGVSSLAESPRFCYKNRLHIGQDQITLYERSRKS